MDAREKAIEKIRKKAFEWHSEKEKTEDFKEQDAEQAEINLIKEIKQIIVDSNIERKAIYLTTLAEQEKRIEKGIDSSKLPDIIKNLLKKPEIHDRVLTVCRKHRINGQQIAYLWGLT